MTFFNLFIPARFMKGTLLNLAIVSLAIFASLGIVSAAEIQTAFNRADQIYACGEEAVVTLTVVDENGSPAALGQLEVNLTNDNKTPLCRYVFNLAEENPVTIRETLAFPGVIQFSASFKPVGQDSERVQKLAAAAFDPYKIEPGLPEPEDFAEFVARGKKEVREIPIDVQMTPIDSLSDDAVSANEISFATLGGQRVYGFLSMPKEIKEPLPVIISIPGAGPGRGPNVKDAREGFVTLLINVFPYPVPLDADERNERHNQFNKDLGIYYAHWNSDNRETYFYRPLYLGIDRAIDWLAEQPFVDASRIGYVGSSQGGGSGLILCGMNHHIKAAVVGVPALCDHGGGLTGRAAGWPHIADQANDHPDALEASRYCDAVNFARHIPKETSISMTVGFIDPVCSPSSIFAAFNQLPSADKKMFPGLAMGHQVSKEYVSEFQKMKEELKKN